MNRKVIIIIVLVVVLAGGGVVAFMMLGNSGEPVGDVVTFFPLPDKITTNTVDGDKMVQAAIVLTLTNAGEVAEELTGKMHVIRDVIVFTLNSKTTDELLAPGFELSLKTELASKLNQELGVEYITTLYFSDFVLT